MVGARSRTQVLDDFGVEVVGDVKDRADKGAASGLAFDTHGQIEADAEGSDVSGSSGQSRGAVVS